MENSKKYYWGIFEGQELLFEGSFSQCWIEFLARFPTMTVKLIGEKNIRIARKS
jgi:hypothetical protein